jgi:hypothetical protein
VNGFFGCLLWKGTLTCWGDNTFGELGNGTMDNAPHPLPEHAGGTHTFATIAVGGVHACGLDAAGTAYCWGLNDDNQCGPGCTAAPTAMFTAHRFVALSAGRTHTCGIDEAGNAYCWGSNAYGALGTASDPTLTFNQVPGGPFKAIAAAQDNTCALTTAGKAFCWGINPSDVLGTVAHPDQLQGDPPVAYSPTQAAYPIAFASISASAFNACGVDPMGAGFCWGLDADGQLGNGASGPDSPSPVRFQVPSGVLIKQMVGMWPICALSTTGDVYCAGSNRYGALGLGTADMDPHPIPTLVPGLPAIAEIASNSWSTCALTADGKRYCWGENGYGQLGDGTTMDRWSPTLTP